MSDKFNKELSELYKQVATKQKNTKGDPHKGDSLENFRGKKGFNDVGIPLSPKAAKKQHTNRSSYNYPHHLQRINEAREKAAMDRHGITDKTNPFNLKKTKLSAQPAVRSTRSNSWSLPYAPAPRKKEYHYYSSDPAPKAEPITYVAPYEAKRKETLYKSTGKFPKIDEAIAAAKKHRDEQ